MLGFSVFKSSQIRLQAALEERQGFAPRDPINEAVSYQADELASELRGMADHFLRRDALTLRNFGTSGGLLAFNFLLPDACLLQCHE